MYNKINNIGFSSNNIFTENKSNYKVALYIRLSKEDDNESESQSVTNQRSMLLEYTQKNMLYVYDEYIDDGFSGGSFDRPAFNRMIGDIENKKINMVITKDMSRLGRDYIQTGYYMERYFPENGVRYISLLDGVDTGVDSAINDITPFKAIMNDMYAKDISKKIKSVKHDKQRKGLFIGGKATYGYIISPDEKNKIIVDRDAAEIVKTIFDLALSGKSSREIAVILNENKIPPPSVYANINITRKGPYTGLWSAERITHTLKNQIYIGNMVQGITKKINYKSKKSIKNPKENWVIVENTHEPIIQKSDFDKVQILLESRKKIRVRKYDYLLKGLIFCKECGYPLGVINRTLSDDKQVLYFICRTYQRFTKAGACSSHCVRVEVITDMVVDKIRDICESNIDDKIAEDIINSAIRNNKQHYGIEKRIQLINNSIHKYNINMDKAYEDRLNGVLEEKDFKRIYLNIRKERDKAQKELESIKKNDIKNKKQHYDKELLIKEFIESVDKNRELLISLVEKIELNKDKEIYINFKYNNINNITPSYLQ